LNSLSYAGAKVIKWGFDGKSIEGYTIYPKESTPEVSSPNEKKRRSNGPGPISKKSKVSSPT
jgi:hypothetical protein